MTQLLLPPIEPVFARDLGSIEAELGVTLPKDYKNFLTTYGLGAIDGFLWILNPSSQEWNLQHQLQQQRRFHLDLSLAAGHDVIPYPLYPEDGGLLPWGITTNGDVCYWVTAAASPELWVVFVEDSETEWEQFSGSMTAYIMALLSGTYDSKIFPPDFPRSVPTHYHGWWPHNHVTVVFAPASISHEGGLEILQRLCRDLVLQSSEAQGGVMATELLLRTAGWRMTLSSKSLVALPPFVHGLTLDLPHADMRDAKELVVRMAEQGSLSIEKVMNVDADGYREIWSDIVERP